MAIGFEVDMGATIGAVFSVGGAFGVRVNGCAEAMNTHHFRPSKRGTFLTSLQGCIHGVSELMCIHCWCLGSNYAG